MTFIVTIIIFIQLKEHNVACAISCTSMLFLQSRASKEQLVLAFYTLFMKDVPIKFCICHTINQEEYCG